MKKSKLFKVEMRNYKGEVYVIADSYDEAVERALIIRSSKGYDGETYDEEEDDEEDDSILDKDGSLKDNKKSKKNKYSVKSVELLTENMVGIFGFDMKTIKN